LLPLCDPFSVESGPMKFSASIVLGLGGGPSSCHEHLWIKFTLTEQISNPAASNPTEKLKVLHIKKFHQRIL
jgi:hypothetical protein